MRVHITGERGFIAGHLRRELRGQGHEVTGSDVEAALAPELVLASEPELVVHAGAVVGRDLRGLDTQRAVLLNVVSTELLANACAEAGVRLLYVSSSECARPFNLYGLSKKWGEEACELRMPPERLLIARLSMPYGPGHAPGSGRAALTNFLWAALHDEPLVVHRDSSRSWCWIGDTVRALALLCSDRAGVGYYYVGRDDNEHTMLAVAELCVEAVPGCTSPIEVVDPPPGYALHKHFRFDRLHALGWRPTVELEEGIERTLEWLEEREA